MHSWKDIWLVHNTAIKWYYVAWFYSCKIVWRNPTITLNRKLWKVSHFWSPSHSPCVYVYSMQTKMRECMVFGTNKPMAYCHWKTNVFDYTRRSLMIFDERARWLMIMITLEMRQKDIISLIGNLNYFFHDNFQENNRNSLLN